MKEILLYGCFCILVLMFVIIALGDDNDQDW
jgi:hypothetical protein